MIFKESKAIYLQIAERLCDEILLKKYEENERIPSVREYAASMEVNANTTMRSYDYLQNRDIIYNRRGIGYFVATGARRHILTLRRKEFMQNDLPEFFKQMKTLNITMEDVTRWYNEKTKQ